MALLRQQGCSATVRRSTRGPLTLLEFPASAVESLLLLFPVNFLSVSIGRSSLSLGDPHREGQTQAVATVTLSRCALGPGRVKASRRSARPGTGAGTRSWGANKQDTGRSRHRQARLSFQPLLPIPTSTSYEAAPIAL